MGNFSAALEDVREALELAPNCTEVRNLLTSKVGEETCTLDTILLQECKNITSNESHYSMSNILVLCSVI